MRDEKPRGVFGARPRRRSITCLNRPLRKATCLTEARFPYAFRWCRLPMLHRSGTIRHGCFIQRESLGGAAHSRRRTHPRDRHRPLLARCDRGSAARSKSDVLRLIADVTVFILSLSTTSSENTNRWTDICRAEGLGGQTHRCAVTAAAPWAMGCATRVRRKACDAQKSPRPARTEPACVVSLPFPTASETSPRVHFKLTIPSGRPQSKCQMSCLT
jgi:hypothetical protein